MEMTRMMDGEKSFAGRNRNDPREDSGSIRNHMLAKLAWQIYLSGPGTLVSRGEGEGRVSDRPCGTARDRVPL